MLIKLLLCIQMLILKKIAITRNVKLEENIVGPRVPMTDAVSVLCGRFNQLRDTVHHIQCLLPLLSRKILGINFSCGSLEAFPGPHGRGRAEIGFDHSPLEVVQQWGQPVQEYGGSVEIGKSSKDGPDMSGPEDWSLQPTRRYQVLQNQEPFSGETQLRPQLGPLGVPGQRRQQFLVDQRLLAESPRVVALRFLGLDEVRPIRSDEPGVPPLKAPPHILQPIFPT